MARDARPLLLGVVLVGVAMGASGAHAQCTARGSAPVHDFHVEVGEPAPLALQFERADLEVDLPSTFTARQRLEARARASLEVVGRVSRADLAFALGPPSILGEGMIDLRSPFTASLERVRSEGEETRADVVIAGFGRLHEMSVPCASVVIAHLPQMGSSPIPTVAPVTAGLRPRRGRIQLYREPGSGASVWWAPAGRRHILELLETRGRWLRVRASLSDGSHITAWVARADVTERRIRLPNVGTVGHGSGTGGWCTWPDALETHGLVRDGTEIARTPDGMVIARARGAQSFRILVRPGAAWIGILDAPDVHPTRSECVPLGWVRADSVERGVYHRVGLQLRFEGYPIRIVIVEPSAGAIEMGARAGDEIIGAEETAPHSLLGDIARAFADGEISVRVRRDGVELELPALRGMYRGSRSYRRIPSYW